MEFKIRKFEIQDKKEILSMMEEFYNSDAVSTNGSKEIFETDFEKCLIDFPYLDNYNAININKVVNIPKDFDGYMAVPITFMDKYNPEQFEIIDGIGRYSILDNENTKKAGNYLSMVEGVPQYFRILIKHKEK